jgi:hypothetical protein
MFIPGKINDFFRMIAPDYGYPVLDLEQNTVKQESIRTKESWTEISKNILNPFIPQHPLYDFRKFVPETVKKSADFRRMTIRPNNSELLALKRLATKYTPRMSMIKQFKEFSAFSFNPNSPTRRKVTFGDMHKILTTKDPLSPSKTKMLNFQKSHSGRLHRGKKDLHVETIFHDDLVKNHKIIIFPKSETMTRRHSDLILHSENWMNWKIEDILEKAKDGISSRFELESTSNFDSESFPEKRLQPRRGFRGMTQSIITI